MEEERMKMKEDRTGVEKRAKRRGKKMNNKSV